MRGGAGRREEQRREGEERREERREGGRDGGTEGVCKKGGESKVFVEATDFRTTPNMQFRLPSLHLDGATQQLSVNKKVIRMVGPANLIITAVCFVVVLLAISA